MLPAGYTARPLDFVDSDGFLDGPDVDLAYEVVCAADIGVLGKAEHSRETVRANLTNPDAQVGEHRLVMTGARDPVGLLVVERDAFMRLFVVDSYAAPRHSRHILASLVGMGLSAARRLGADGQWEVEAGAYAQDEAYRDVLENAGFREVRRFWRMIIDQRAEHRVQPEAPSGVTLTVAVSDEERRLLHDVEQESFAGQFGFAPEPYDEFSAWGIDRRDARPDLWWLARIDDRPVGMCVMDDSHADRGASHVEMLGVIPQARGRGIASWLLRSAFFKAASEGRTSVTLTVDADNTTGATALYEGVGMRAEQVRVHYRRPLASLGDFKPAADTL
jgi:mycothiol synthase